MEKARQHSAVSDAPVTDRKLAAAVEAQPFWYHRIELPGGVVTPGWAPMDAAMYRIPEDLTGKRVLDIGAWDGYWTFEALKRGAREVVAIDDFSDFLGKTGPKERHAWQTFDLCRAALGWSEDRCKRMEMTVYDLSEELLGRFDIVFFFGTLYHLRHPLLGLDRISAITDEMICVESAILDDFSISRGGLSRGYGNQMVMEFYPRDEYGQNNSNWWVPTLAVLAHLVGSAGFKGVEAWKLQENPQSLPQCRGFAKGWKTSKGKRTRRIPPIRIVSGNG